MRALLVLLLGLGFSIRAGAASTKLSLIGTELIESVQPYDRLDGVYSSRPAILDDLVYESLFVKDPVYNSDNLHPLIASSLQWSADFSTLTFQLDPLARFQDGSSVTAADVLFSIEEYKRSSIQAEANMNRWVQSIEVQGLSIVFHLQSQESRPRIADALASIKIIKPSRLPQPKLSGISVNFIGTGAYRIAQLGPTKIVLIKDPFYWAGFYPLRRLLFNFSTVEVTSFTQPAEIENALAAGASNFIRLGRTNRVESTIQQLMARNPKLVLRRELNDKMGEPVSSYAFNLRRKPLQDIRVRQALFLAFDFNKINQNAFSFSLYRPSSLLDYSPLLPTGVPTDEARRLLLECEQTEALPTTIFADFSTYGTSLYRAFADDRARLLEASRLLQQAGYRLVNGKLVNGSEPLEISILIRDKAELPIVATYQDALVHMGIPTTIITPASRAEFVQQLEAGEYDLSTAEELLLSPDGMPEAGRYTNPSHLQSPCMDKMLRHLADWDAASEVVGRLHQALYLSIFAGEPRYKDFIMDRRVRVPDGLSYSRAHAYGYWQPEE